jgi:hypothetical protein
MNIVPIFNHRLQKNIRGGLKGLLRGRQFPALTENHLKVLNQIDQLLSSEIRRPDTFIIEPARVGFLGKEQL